MSHASVQNTQKPRVVIVGAGFAGLAAAKYLAQAPVEIVLLDRRNYHLFQPLLYQVATATLSPAQIAQPIRAILKKQRNCTSAIGEVTAIDTTRQVVKGHKGELPYDYLILATGATHTYFGHDDWATTAPGLKTIEDATGLRRRILEAFEKAEITDDVEERKRLMRFVIVGGGPTGVEMAGAIAELAQQTLVDDFRRIHTPDAEVILIEAGERLLAAFPPHLSAYAQKSLEQLHVQVLTRHAVEECSRARVKVAGKWMPVATIIWAAGVKASPAAEWLGVPHDRAGRVYVQGDLSVAGHPNIFVIGDTAAVTDATGRQVPGLAPAAEQQGKYAASVIRSLVGKREKPSPFSYKDLGTMATIGRSKAIALIKGVGITGFIAWWLWGIIHIMPLVGFRNRVVVALDWLWTYLTFGRSVRLITKNDREETDI